MINFLNKTKSKIRTLIPFLLLYQGPGAGFVKMLGGWELDNKKIVSIILISLAIVYLDYSLVIKLQSRSIKTINVKITKLKKDIDALAKDLASLEDIKRKEGKQGLAPMTKKAISEDELTALLQDISNMANKHNVTLIQIKPSKELKAKEEKTPSQGKFNPVLITLDVSCDYHRLGGFVNDLENAKQFMAVWDTKIKSDPRDYLRQNVNLVLKTYVKK